MTAIRRILGYIRVSTDRQKQHGYSEAAQRETIEKYAEYLKTLHPELQLELSTVFVEPEGVSANKVKLFQRKAGKQLLAAARPGDFLVFAVHDRCFRNMKDFCASAELFESRGISLHFANIAGMGALDCSSPTGKMLIYMMMAFAEYESDCISLRTKAAFAAKKREKGYVRAPAKIGDQVVGVGRNRGAVPDKLVRSRMRWIAYVRDKHGWSWMRISDLLEEHLAAREGRDPIKYSAWHPSAREWHPKRCEKAYNVVKLGHQNDMKQNYVRADDLPANYNRGRVQKRRARSRRA